MDADRVGVFNIGAEGEGSMLSENRNSDRRRMRFRVECWKADEPSKKIRAEGVSISLGGVGLKLREAVKSGDSLCLRIAKSFWGKPIEARGKVVWQEGHESSGVIMAGVKFVEAPWTELEEMVYG